MARINAIVDTGFIVGAMDAADQWHPWAAREFPNLCSPALTCEAVVSEACFQLRRTSSARSQLLAWIRCGGLEVHPILPAEIDQIEKLFARFGIRMDYADACLVRLSELHRGHAIVTTDAKDFRIHRRFRREALPLLTP
jgi:predicted nucleic acid-binding protein